MNIIYPNRDLHDLYIENQSVWEEVFAGDLEAEDALDYMRIEEGSDLWVRALESLQSGNAPL